MTGSPASTKKNGRRAILDLAPLELDCLHALWPLGQATVRQVRDAMAATKPRAYTTVMTILDRMAQKGLVERHKQGRAYIYRPVITREEACADAVGQVVEHFFEGSPEALAAHVAGDAAATSRERPGTSERPLAQRPSAERPRAPRKKQEVPAETPALPSPVLDASLL